MNIHHKKFQQEFQKPDTLLPDNNDNDNNEYKLESESIYNQNYIPNQITNTNTNKFNTFSSQELIEIVNNDQINNNNNNKNNPNRKKRKSNYSKEQSLLKLQIDCGLEAKQNGNKLFKENKISEAMKEFEKSILLLTTINKDFSVIGLIESSNYYHILIECLNNLSVCKIKKSQFDDVISISNKVLSYEKNNIKALCYKSKALFHIGNYKECLVYSKFVYANFNCDEIRRQIHDCEGKINESYQLLTLREDDSNAYGNSNQYDNPLLSSDVFPFKVKSLIQLIENSQQDNVLKRLVRVVFILIIRRLYKYKWYLLLISSFFGGLFLYRK
jgi:hypothetical protein